MPRGSLLQSARNAIGDTAGFYDEFSIEQLLAWLPHTPHQILRDALRSMRREGVMIRVSRGVYRWRV